MPQVTLYFLGSPFDGTQYVVGAGNAGVDATTLVTLTGRMREAALGDIVIADYVPVLCLYLNTDTNQMHLALTEVEDKEIMEEMHALIDRGAAAIGASLKTAVSRSVRCNDEATFRAFTLTYASPADMDSTLEIVMLDAVPMDVDASRLLTLLGAVTKI